MIDIERVLKSEMDSDLSVKGFAFDDNCYFKSDDSFLTYFLSFDFNESDYRVFVGIARRDDNGRIDEAPEGAYLHRYFTGGSLSDTPKSFPFKSEADVREHLIRLKNNLESIIFPFFESTTNLEQYADNLSITDCMVSYEVYRELGLIDKSIQKGKVVLEQYKNMRDIPKINNRLKEIEKFIEGESSTLNKLLQRIKKSCAFLAR